MKTISNALISTFTGNANNKQQLISFGILFTILVVIVGSMHLAGVIHFNKYE